MNCIQVTRLIPAYVSSQLTVGEDEDVQFPNLWKHIESCSDCEKKYYREFRRQGLQKPIEELRKLSTTSPNKSVFDLIGEAEKKQRKQS